jgi:copper homeostasis protein
MSKKLEIACFDFQSALNAEKGNADRIELCDDAKSGGITPKLEIVKLVLSSVFIPVYIMIRPRGGDFIYSDEEFNQMKKDIIDFKNEGAKGFVFGILSKNNTVDKDRCKELVNVVSPLPCTFHRAFDEAANVEQALEDIIKCGFKTILTSGQMPKAVDGIDTLGKLIQQANNRITIMPGGGVRSENLSFLKNKLSTDWFHSSAITDNSEIANSEEVSKMKKILQ